LVEVICDTSFLIHIANNRIKNLATLDTEIGSIRFVVPDTVITELQNLAERPDKKDAALSTIQYIKPFKTVSLGGSFADEQFVSLVKRRGGVIATMDRELKTRIKNSGGSVISVSSNRIVLESSKV